MSDLAHAPSEFKEIAGMRAKCVEPVVLPIYINVGGLVALFMYPAGLKGLGWFLR
jgi:hypothetical protein